MHITVKCLVSEAVHHTTCDYYVFLYLLEQLLGLVFGVRDQQTARWNFRMNSIVVIRWSHIKNNNFADFWNWYILYVSYVLDGWMGHQRRFLNYP